VVYTGDGSGSFVAFDAVAGKRSGMHALAALPTRETYLIAATTCWSRSAIRSDFVLN
jgi:hypothetical protein